MKALPIFFFAITGVSLSVLVVGISYATNGNFSGFSGFGQRYGANSFITTQPLYFKEIDCHGRIIRPHARFVTAPVETASYENGVQEKSYDYRHSPFMPTGETGEPTEQVTNPRKTHEDYYNYYAKRFRNLALNISQWFHH